MSENSNHSLRLLEALLFASDIPLSLAILEERMPPGTQTRALLNHLQQNYADKGVHLEEIDGAWAFRTAADLADDLVLMRAQEKPLSRAAMETLSIIAYHQPVTRGEIENIRGVATSKGTLDILMEMEWVKPGRRRETPGRPLTWKTSQKFMDHFGLEDISHLPGLDDLKASGMLDQRPAIETIPLFDEENDNEEEQKDIAHV